MGSRATECKSALRRDDGIALITVLGVMLIVTLLAIGSYTIARQSLFEATRAADESRAFRAASAGIDQVLSTFNPASTPAAITGSTPDGSFSVTLGETGGDAGEWEIISVGVGLDGTQETVVQRFFYINLWEMNFAGTGSQSLMSGSSGMNGSSNIYGPFYIKGNMAVEANMSVMEGPLFVKDGDLTTTSGASQIGEAAKLVRLYCDGDVDVTKGTVFITGPSLSVPEIELPKLTADDMQSYALQSQAESIDGKMSRQTDSATAPLNHELVTRSAAYKYFGPADVTAIGLANGTTTLKLGTAGRGSFGCWGSVTTTGAVLPAKDVIGGVVSAAAPTYGAGDAGIFDDFAYWDEYTSEWDLLYISGTVFVDGPLIIDDDIMYIGNGTIVANGPVMLNGRVRPYSYTTADIAVNKVGEDKKWAMGIVTPDNITMKGNGSNDGTEPVRNNPFDYAGAFYTDKTLFVPQPLTSLRGSILSNKMEFASPNTDLVTNPLLPTYLPDSLPGGGEGIITRGLWSRQ